MGEHTSIKWTYIIPTAEGATWNPFRAVDNQTRRTGYMCTKVSKGCDNCYASLINATKPSGLEFEYPVKGSPEADELKKKISFFISDAEGSQTAIDWPLKAKKSRGIFPVSMSDWLGEFVPTAAASHLLGTMLLCQHHIFLPLTKRWRPLTNLVRTFSQQGDLGIAMIEDTLWNTAIIRLKGIRSLLNWDGRQHIRIFNSRFTAAAPWPPRNILFGLTVCTVNEARAAKKYIEEIKMFAPNIRLWVNQGPALEVIDWKELGYTKNHFEWLVWEGESGHKARRAHEAGAEKVIEFGEDQGIPVFIKQMGTIIGLEWDIDTKGEKIPVDHDYYVREFPPIENDYVEWPK